MTRIDIGLPGSFGGMKELENEPPVSWLIKNWLAAREISCLYGDGGTFKSYIALGWTMQLALGPTDTMYVAAEGTSGLRSRVDAWMAARGKSGQHLKRWHYYNANVHIDDENGTGMWLNGMSNYLKKKPKPKLIVIDTMARNFAGDESSPKEVGMFIEGCEYLRRELDTAILVIHHTGVATGRERGTAALRNATFAMFKTSHPRYNDTGGGSVALVCDRMKDAPMPDDVRIHFDTVALDIAEHGDVYRQSQAMRWFPPKKKDKPRRTVIRADKEEK